jgi:Subtilase family
MSDLSHLRLENSASSFPYTYPGAGSSSPFRLPPRDRVPHAQQLAASLKEAEASVAAIREEQPAIEQEVDGVPITVRSDANYELPLEKLDRRRDGIELLSVKAEALGVTAATLFVRRDKIVALLRLIEQYEKEDVTRLRKDGTASTRPRNEELFRSIASIRQLALQDLWQDELALYPRPDESTWWEVWARRGNEEPESTHRRLQRIARSAGITISTRFVHFPERIVTLVYGTGEKLGASLDFLSATAELRLAKEVPTPYLNLSPRDQRAFIDDAIGRLLPPAEDAPAVCLLDTGVNRHHPLIAPALARADWQAVDPDWGASDHHPAQHGTGMAGIALYRCLTDIFHKSGPIQLVHRLESVKLLPPPPQVNAPDVYGDITMQAVAKAEIAAPARKRAICMAVTTMDDRDHGLPSSWSAAVDQMCAGGLDEDPKLMFISAGNYYAVLDDADYVYPHWNCQKAGIQDPSQAWNAVTVGGYTDLVTITDPNFDGWKPIASAGDLSPTSRTSQSWPEDKWPIKPDIVMEGGNYVHNGKGPSSCPDLSLLTTIVHPTGRLLTEMGDTSAATAAAARMAAILWSRYPRLRPETIRALIVHSARWKAAMLERFPGKSKAAVQKRLRCYGFGVPDLHRALYSAENAATLLFEGEIQPFERKDGKVKTREMHIHELPWPRDVLLSLSETPVTMRVTLSYFIDPSPGRKGWGRKFRFQSHGLRFDVKRPLEDRHAFEKRVSRAAWDEDEGRPENVKEVRNWAVGRNGRARGSVHSDWWEGTASELAACGYLAVVPVTGWWRERPHLGKVESKARYSLAVSIETPGQQVDLYHAIENFATVNIESEV